MTRMSGARADAMVTVFFYGLFMDAELLHGKGVVATEPRAARLDGYRLVIDTRATLIPADGDRVHGIVMRVSAADLRRLYSKASVSAYRAQAVKVAVSEGGDVDAACYIAPAQSPGGAANRDYAERLLRCAEKLGLPAEYLEAIRRAGSLASPEDS